MKKSTKILGGIILAWIIIGSTSSLIKLTKKLYTSIRDPKIDVGMVCLTNEIYAIDRTVQQLRTFFEDTSIKAIILNIDSPGGAAGSSEALYNEIIELKKDFPKPIITYTQNMCASGGYMVACATDYIISTPSAIVGSIGSYIAYFKLDELMKEWKIGYKIHKSGDYKTSINPFAPSTPQGDELLQEMSGTVYTHFVELVANARRLPIDKASEWANGKIFTGLQAHKLGLVDDLGSLCTAHKKIKELLKTPKKINIVKPPKASFFEQLRGDNDEGCSASLRTFIQETIRGVFKEQCMAKL